uniref:Uncharacterized protein n=1 Tax=Arundo donax TaxID=35708 RepID=A0A0A9CQB4_ARUDO
MWRLRTRNVLIRLGSVTIIQISTLVVTNTSLYHLPMSSVEVWGSITLQQCPSLSLERWD